MSAEKATRQHDSAKFGHRLTVAITRRDMPEKSEMTLLWALLIVDIMNPVVQETLLSYRSIKFHL